MKTWLAGLAAVLLLAGCSEGPVTNTRSASPFEDDVAKAPSDATKEEFCQAWAEGQDPKAQTPADLEAWANGMIEVGTPAEFTKGQRQAFVILVASFLDFPEWGISPSSEDRPKFNEDEQAWVDEFTPWVILNCEEEIKAVSGTPTPSSTKSSAG